MADTVTIELPSTPLPVTRKAAKNYLTTPTRIHEAALQAWLHQHFYVSEGYPVPVIFSTPMHAFSEFGKLWARDAAGNPYAYLLAAKDENGAPLYAPYPSPARYPLINVKSLGIKQRTAQSYSLHIQRSAFLFTTTGTPVLGDMGNVAQGRMPQAWDFRFQVDFFSRRPDTQANFVASLMKAFPVLTGQSQTWIKVAYPGWLGTGQKYCRVTLDEGIETETEEDQSTDQQTCRVTVTLCMEGYVADLDVTLQPALWFLTERLAAISPGQLAGAYPDIGSFTEDLRNGPDNRVLLSKHDLPPAVRLYEVSWLGSSSRVFSPAATVA